MAFGSIELTTISRAQDYSAIKHNEDNKAVLDQTNSQVQVQKNETQRTRQVHSSDNTEWHDDQPDARKKGNGEYYGDGGRRRKQQPAGKAAEKRTGGFDIKI
ncbi:MAG: hypothetical protein NC432_04490 [Roseburia sp.]|nr:hypothetical protein [Roseburia sp.]MCM1096998.1 hypothetical protein [Ruminococcus flavefaciens]